MIWPSARSLSPFFNGPPAVHQPGTGSFFPRSTPENLTLQSAQGRFAGKNVPVPLARPPWRCVEKGGQHLAAKFFFDDMAFSSEPVPVFQRPASRPPAGDWLIFPAI